MKEIRDWLYDTVRADAAFQAATGGDGTDGINARIYFQYPPEEFELSATKPAFAVYVIDTADEIDGEDFVYDHSLPSEIINVVIWGVTQSDVDDTFKAVEAALQEGRPNTTTYFCLRVALTSQDDGLEDGTMADRIFFKVTRWRFGPLLKK
tara:strand:+ start:488 stop:940 length:453 start_codon:yes stop_codon:yes gene_type:complete